MTFPVKIRKMINYDSGVTDVYLDVTGPGAQGGPQTAGTVVITGVPTPGLVGVLQGQTFNMSFA